MSSFLGCGCGRCVVGGVQVGFLEKDVPVPYVSAMAPGSAPADPAQEWGRRPILLFFRGHVARRKNVSGPRRGSLCSKGNC